jgi:hypothetical protein
MELAWVLSLRPEVRSARSKAGPNGLLCIRSSAQLRHAAALADLHALRVSLIFFVDDFTLGRMCKTAHFSRKSGNWYFVFRESK